MNKIRPAHALAITAVAAGALIASALPGSAEVGAQSPSVGALRVLSPATVLADGAALAVQVSFVCPQGVNAHVSTQVTQRVNNALATGNGSTSIPSCTGSTQYATVNLHASGKPFRKGTAFASGYLSVPLPGGPYTDHREIQLEK
ncbi:hypothetical protein [Saccharothrix obliqua]|uniref:hypothetical protein n=1 Tax=Saccharothrix obliqua TaxID=2861747 RepID=UPI001C602171|nr:hypothetical protein [Saccharothrix obliqua]MBW4716302.1 hypothetical protein [Saccharothrix obliqua]